MSPCVVSANVRPRSRIHLGFEGARSHARRRWSETSRPVVVVLDGVGTREREREHELRLRGLHLVGEQVGVRRADVPGLEGELGGDLRVAEKREHVRRFEDDRFPSGGRVRERGPRVEALRARAAARASRRKPPRRPRASGRRRTSAGSPRPTPIFEPGYSPPPELRTPSASRATCCADFATTIDFASVSSPSETTALSPRKMPLSGTAATVVKPRSRKRLPDFRRRSSGRRGRSSRGARGRWGARCPPAPERASARAPAGPAGAPRGGRAAASSAAGRAPESRDCVT